MPNIYNDKYHTPPSLAEHAVVKTNEVIGKENISEFLEPSAGKGVFLDYFDKPYLAYDIEPEDDRIVKQNYLCVQLGYKEKRCVIGNPPYGEKNTLAVQFYKRSIKLGDYVSFILPASQYNNSNQMYEFDLVYSELVDNKGFVGLDKRIKLSFNIYKRNPLGLNSKPNYKLDNVVIREARRGAKHSVVNGYDIGFCSFGWSIGKETEFIGQYANEFYLYVSPMFKEKVVSVIRNSDWREIVKNMTGMEKINQWQVYKYIKEQIPEIS